MSENCAAVSRPSPLGEIESQDCPEALHRPWIGGEMAVPPQLGHLAKNDPVITVPVGAHSAADLGCDSRLWQGAGLGLALKTGDDLLPADRPVVVEVEGQELAHTGWVMSNRPGRAGAFDVVDVEPITITIGRPERQHGSVDKLLDE